MCEIRLFFFNKQLNSHLIIGNFEVSSHIMRVVGSAMSTFGHIVDSHLGVFFQNYSSLIAGRFRRKQRAILVMHAQHGFDYEYILFKIGKWAWKDVFRTNKERASSTTSIESQFMVKAIKAFCISVDWPINSSRTMFFYKSNWYLSCTWSGIRRGKQASPKERLILLMTLRSTWRCVVVCYAIVNVWLG